MVASIEGLLVTEGLKSDLSYDFGKAKKYLAEHALKFTPIFELTVLNN